MPSPDRSNRRPVYAALPVLLLCQLWAPGCGSGEEPVVRESVAMNTYVTVSVYDPPLSPAETAARIDSALAEIRRVEALASDYSDSSEIGRVNRAAGSAGVRVSPEILDLVRLSLRYAALSGNAFNIAVGPLVKEWDFLAEHPRIPDARTIDSLLVLVDLSAVDIRGDTLTLRRKGMALDLGGIAKGYAVDRALASLRRGGIRRAIVDIGGNLGIAWDDAAMLEGGAAGISVRDPRNDGTMFGSFPAGNAGVSTSGDYQRCFITDGKRFHHVLDPATGYPAAGVVSVTIVAPDAVTADILSTLVFVLGKERGLAFIGRLQGVEGLVIREEGDSLVGDATAGLRRVFERGEPRD